MTEGRPPGSKLPTLGIAIVACQLLAWAALAQQLVPMTVSQQELVLTRISEQPYPRTSGGPDITLSWNTSIPTGPITSQGTATSTNVDNGLRFSVNWHVDNGWTGTQTFSVGGPVKVALDIPGAAGAGLVPILMTVREISNDVAGDAFYCALDPWQQITSTQLGGDINLSSVARVGDISTSGSSPNYTLPPASFHRSKSSDLLHTLAGDHLEFWMSCGYDSPGVPGPSSASGAETFVADFRVLPEPNGSGPLASGAAYLALLGWSRARSVPR